MNFAQLKHGWRSIVAVGAAASTMFAAGASAAGALKIPGRVAAIEQRQDAQDSVLAAVLREFKTVEGLERQNLCMTIAEHQRSEHDWNACLLMERR